MGSKWRPVLKVWEQPQDKHTSDAKLLYMNTLSHSNVKYTPRVPLILLTVEKLNVKLSILFFNKPIS